MRRTAKATLLLAATLGSGACSITFDARTLGSAAIMASVPDSMPVGDTFKVTRKAVYVFWGAAAASRPSLQQTLAGQVTGNDRIANLRIKVSSSFGDLLATALTGGLIVPRSVTYEGVVVHGAAPAPPPAQ